MPATLAATAMASNRTVHNSVLAVRRFNSQRALNHAAFMVCRSVRPAAIAASGRAPGRLGRCHVTQPPVCCGAERSEEHTSELQSLMRISYAVFCLKKKKTKKTRNHISTQKTTIIKHTNHKKQ